jgi:putative ABC transport system permease protein
VLNFLPLLLANLWRRRVRTILTIASVATAFLLYGLLEALRYALTGGVDLAGADRLIVTHKVSIIQSLPRSYLNRIAGLEGVRVATANTWFGGIYQDERNVIVAQVADADTLLEVYPEVLVSPEQRRAWRDEPTGALIGESLAGTYGWKIGDKIPLRSNIYRQRDGSDTWDLKISGIYRVKDGAGDTSSLFLHYKYFNESVSYGRDQAGWITLRVRDPARMADTARRIDALFANSFTETKTASERAFAQGWINMIGNVGAIITGIVSAVFFTMLLVTANTMAQAIRERTSELAVMKTLGFSGWRVLWLVLAESLLITVLGGALGMLFAGSIVDAAQEALRQYLPLLTIPPQAYVVAALFIVGLGLLSGAMPAWQAWRLRITTALRRT